MNPRRSDTLDRAREAFIRWSKRLLPAASLACVGLWLTALWPGRRPVAEGTVYEKNAQGAAQVARYLSGLAHTGEIRVGRFNNNLVFYRVCSSRDTIREIFDYYEKLYRVRPAPSICARVPGGMAGLVARLGAQVADLNNVYRQETKEMGLFGVIQLGPDWEKTLFQRIQRFTETGRIADLGAAKMIVAFRPPRSRRTTFITFWPGPGFNVRNLYPPAPGQDAPGRDLPDAPRCPGLRRIASMEEGASFARGYVGLYESDGPLNDVAEFYSSRMPRFGWTQQTPAMRPGPQESDTQTLFFAKGKKEATILIRNLNRGEAVQVVVMCRWPGSE